MLSKEYSLDDLGRIVQESITQQDGLSAQTDYQYDGLGRITQLSDGENTQGFDYDKVGRLVQQRQYRLNANGIMIVDDNGQVVEIYQIASSGKDAKVIGTINIGDYQ